MKEEYNYEDIPDKTLESLTRKKCVDDLTKKEAAILVHFTFEEGRKELGKDTLTAEEFESFSKTAETMLFIELFRRKGLVYLEGDIVKLTKEGEEMQKVIKQFHQ